MEHWEDFQDIGSSKEPPKVNILGNFVCKSDEILQEHCTYFGKNEAEIHQDYMLELFENLDTRVELINYDNFFVEEKIRSSSPTIFVEVIEEVETSKNVQNCGMKDVMDSFEEFLINNVKVTEVSEVMDEVGSDVVSKENLIPIEMMATKANEAVKAKVHDRIKLPIEELEDFRNVQNLEKADFIDFFEEFLISSLNVESEVIFNDNLSSTERPYILDVQAIRESKEEIPDCNNITRCKEITRFKEAVDSSLEVEDSVISEDTKDEITVNVQAEHYRNLKQCDHNIKISEVDVTGIIENKTTSNDPLLSEENITKSDFVTEMTVNTKLTTFVQHSNNSEELADCDDYIQFLGTEETMTVFNLLEERSDESSTINNISMNEQESQNDLDKLELYPRNVKMEATKAKMDNTDSKVEETLDDEFTEPTAIDEKRNNEETYIYNTVSVEKDEGIEVLNENENRQYDDFEELHNDTEIVKLEVPDEVEVLACKSFIAEEMVIMLGENGDLEKDEHILVKDAEVALDESFKTTVFSAEIQGYLEPSEEREGCSSIVIENSTTDCKKIESIEQSQKQCDNDALVPQDVTIEKLENTEVEFYNNKEWSENIEIRSAIANNDHLQLVEVMQSTLSTAETQVEAESSEDFQNCKNFEEGEKNIILVEETTGGVLERNASAEVSEKNQIETDNSTLYEDTAKSIFIECIHDEELPIGISKNEENAEVRDNKVEIPESEIHGSGDFEINEIIDVRGDRYVVIDEVNESIVIETQDQDEDHKEVGDSASLEKNESVEASRSRKRQCIDQAEESEPSTKLIKLEMNAIVINVSEETNNSEVQGGNEAFSQNTVTETVIVNNNSGGTPDLSSISNQLTKETQKRKCDNTEEHAPSPKMLKVEPNQVQEQVPNLRLPEITKSQSNPVLTRIILGNPMTSTWQFTSHYPYRLFNLIKLTPEYEQVTKIFKKTATRRMSISNIYRVENPYLLGQYLLKKEKMERTCDRSHQVIERRLFHGTREENIDGICRYNFDWRRRGQARGHKFGQGVSFSPKASYARHYNFGDDVMFLAKVLVSRVIEGNCDTVVPPEPYDTTRNRTGDVIVKYNDDDFYPQYIIYYYYTKGCGFFFNF